MTSFKTVWDCIFSPRLIKIYGNGPVEKFYQPSTIEKWGDQVIHSLYVMWKIGVYTSPLLVGMLYHKGYFTADGLITLSKLVTGVGVFLVVSFCVRGWCRSQNPTYTKFLTVLQNAQNNLTPATKQQMSVYDFEFSAWPIEYKSTSSQVTSKRHIEIMSLPASSNILSRILTIPYNIIAYLAIHTFGIRLVYPGTFGFLQAMLEQSLIQGRSRLIEQFRGERFKLLTSDGNSIDSIFIDRRNSSAAGNVLVICCEGNAGFYEIGITVTPIEAGYSVLGWNHPGFGGSTGQPYPSQEQNAADVVVEFAINVLGFKVENILFFGWSIGGYSSAWAAMNYPEAKGVILDATFDDLLPLAQQHMPRWWEAIVNIAVRQYVNLNVFEQLSKYPGPVLLIRRSQDEVICTRENDLSTNRGNFLLIKLLRSRYPCIFDDNQTELLHEFLAVTGNKQDEFFHKYMVDENTCSSLLQSYISEYSKSYPMKVGEDFQTLEKSQMALFLARKYLRDFKASHCVNLPTEMFQIPWDIHVESDFVFT